MEFITVIDKKKQIKNILGLGSSNTENYNTNGFYFYLQENNLIFTYMQYVCITSMRLTLHQ